MLDKIRLIHDFNSILGWPYSSPGTNDQSGIDCSGAFVRAYKLQSASIYHGSNRIVRVHCHSMKLILHASDLKEAMLVAKRRDDGLEGREYQVGGAYYNNELIGN